MRSGRIVADVVQLLEAGVSFSAACSPSLGGRLRWDRCNSVNQGVRRVLFPVRQTQRGFCMLTLANYISISHIIFCPTF